MDTLKLYRSIVRITGAHTSTGNILKGGAGQELAEEDGNWRMRSKRLSVEESARFKRKGDNASNYYTDNIMEKVVFWTTFSQQQTGSSLHNMILPCTIPEQGHVYIMTFKFLYLRL